MDRYVGSDAPGYNRIPKGVPRVHRNSSRFLARHYAHSRDSLRSLDPSESVTTQLDLEHPDTKAKSRRIATQ